MPGKASAGQHRDRVGRFAETMHAEAGTVLAAGPRPGNGMPVLGSAAAGYTDKLDENGNLVLQVRLVNGKPDDAPDGTAAVIAYSTAETGCTREAFYTGGVLHDGSGDKPSQRLTWPSGATDITRGFRRPHQGSIVTQDSPDGQPGSVRTSASGDTLTAHYANGRLQDPAPGVPAKVHAFADGSRRVTHAPCGRPADLPDGTPAERRYYPDGTAELEWRMHDGQPWDSDDGQPAERHFHPDGSVAKELYVFDGKLLDPAAGKPALAEYTPDGTMTRSESRPYIDSALHGFTDHRNRPSRAAKWSWGPKEPVTRYTGAPATPR
jgi:hypothetical protein